MRVADLDVVAMLTRHRAVSYLHAAMDISPKSNELEPKYFVFSQAIELALKAFLMAKGCSVDFCAKNIGHDLVKASDLAKEHGLVLSDVQNAVLSTLAVQHSRPFSFRYFNPEGWTAPSFVNVERCCRHILTSTQGAIFEACRIPMRPEHKTLEI
jgi:hypothetical protein